MNHAQIKGAFFARLAANDQILRLLDLLPEVSFFIKDLDGRFMAHSLNKFERYDVQREEDVIGKTDHDFYSPSRADAYRADDLMVMKSGEPIVNRLEAAPEAIGSPRLVATSKIPLRDPKGKIIGIAGFSRPVQGLDTGTEVSERLARVIEHLHQNLTEALPSPELATMAGLSVSQFERRFRDACGTSPRQYLLRIRVDAAARLLIGTDRTVSEIAQDCGFHDHAHLSRSFRKIMQHSPSDYRSAHRLESHPAAGKTHQ
ncbi:helix-turn-helix domain-containing protein [Arenicella sp.]|nr:helix-turn-helix domain-containing protein [Arenicella sp.]